MEARFVPRDQEVVGSVQSEQLAGADVHRPVVGRKRRERGPVVDPERLRHVLVPVLRLPPVGRRLERAGDERDRTSGGNRGIDPVAAVQVRPHLRQRRFGEALEDVCRFERAEPGEGDRCGDRQSRSGPTRPDDERRRQRSHDEHGRANEPVGGKMQPSGRRHDRRMKCSGRRRPEDHRLLAV